jgi:3'(2'), 5'-bisphosphate nucleotidase
MNITNSDLLSHLIILSEVITHSVMDIYRRDFDIQIKYDKSPVTEADFLVDRLIAESLTRLTPDIPILSEESPLISYDKRKSLEYLWCIDPIDGTKEFINRNGEFATHLALLHRGDVAFGMVILPIQNEVYFAEKGKGSFVKNKNGIQALSQPRKRNNPIIAVTSRSHHDPRADKFLNKRFRDVVFKPLGSSHKFIALARGEADIYIKFGLTMEWDIAAPLIILEESGGTVRTVEQNRQLEFNKQNLQNPDFVATSPNFSF